MSVLLLFFSFIISNLTCLKSTKLVKSDKTVVVITFTTHHSQFLLVCGNKNKGLRLTTCNSLLYRNTSLVPADDVYHNSVLCCNEVITSFSEVRARYHYCTFMPARRNPTYGHGMNAMYIPVHG